GNGGLIGQATDFGCYAHNRDIGSPPGSVSQPCGLRWKAVAPGLQSVRVRARRCAGVAAAPPAASAGPISSPKIGRPQTRAQRQPGPRDKAAGRSGTATARARATQLLGSTPRTAPI